MQSRKYKNDQKIEENTENELNEKMKLCHIENRTEAEKNQLKQFWKEESEIGQGIMTYLKDEKKKISSTLASGGQGAVYSGIDENSNSRIVFKQFKNNQEYEREKKIYSYLNENIEEIQEYVYLEGVEFDDDYQVIILPQCECTLQDFCQQSFENHMKNTFQTTNQKEQDKKIYELFSQEKQKELIHLNKNQIQYIISFIIEALAAFEKIGLGYCDLKPQNILLMKENKQGKPKIKLVISDFGGAYLKKGDTVKYGFIMTKYFTKRKITIEKELKKYTQGYLDQYSDCEVVEDSIYALIRSVQYCVFGFDRLFGKLKKNGKEWYFCELNIKFFMQDLDSFCGIRFEEFYNKCLNDKIESFQEVFDLFQQFNTNKGVKQNLIEGIDFDIMKEIQENIMKENFQNMIKEHIQKGKWEELFYIGEAYYNHNKFLESNQIFLSLDFKNPDHVIFLCLKYHYLAGISWKIGKIQQSIEYLKQQLRIVHLYLGENDIQVASIYANLGLRYAEIGELKQAFSMQLRGLGIVRSLKGEDCRELIPILRNMGSLYSDFEQYVQALKFYNVCVKLQKLYGEDYCETQCNIGTIYKNQKKFEKGIAIFCSVLDHFKEKQGENSIDSFVPLSNLGNIYQEQGKLDLAEDCILKCFKICENFYGVDSIQVINILNNLAGIKGEKENQKDLNEGIDLCERSLRIIEKYYGENCKQQLDSVHMLALLYMKLGNIDKSLDWFCKAVDLAEKYHGLGSEKYSNIIVNLASIFSDLGKLEQAKDLINKAIKNISKNSQLSKCVHMQYGLGRIYQQYGEFGKALGIYEKCLEIIEKQYGKESVQMSILNNQIGDLYKSLGKYTDSIRYFKRSVLIAEKYYGNQSVQSADGYNNLGTVYMDIENFEEADKLFQKAYMIFKGKYGDNCIQSINTLNNLGGLEVKRGNLDKGIQYYQNSLNIDEQHYGEYCYQSSEKLLNIAVVLAKQKQFLKAEQYAKKGEKIIIDLLGNKAIQLADIYHHTGFVYKEKGEIQKSIYYYQEAIKIFESKFGEGCWQCCESLSCIGDIYYSMGAQYYEKAVQYMQKVEGIYERNFGKNYFKLGHNFYSIGIIKFEQKNYYAAENLFKKCLKIFESSNIGIHNVKVVSDVYNYLGNITGDQGNLHVSVYYHEKSVQILEKYLGKDCVESAGYLTNLGLNLGQIGKIDQGFKYCKKSLDIYLKKYGKGCLESFEPLKAMGNIMEMKGEFSEAVRYQEEALDIVVKYKGKGCKESGSILINLGLWYIQQQKLNKASSVLQESLQVYKGEACQEQAMAFLNLGMMYERQGLSDKSIQEWLKCQEIYEKLNLFGENYTKCQTNLGVSYILKKQPGKARMYLQKSLRIQEQQFGLESIQLLKNIRLLGIQCYNCGNLEESIQYFWRDLQICIKYQTTENLKPLFCLFLIHTKHNTIHLEQNKEIRDNILFGFTRFPLIRFLI